MTAPARRAARRRATIAVHAIAAAVAWVPLLLTAPGRVASDTRAYLYLDPERFLHRARHLWDPFVHLGTVTHQNVGLLVPMGTWFWTADLVGLPDWMAQRLWVGGILFAAAAGVLHLGRTLGWALPSAAASAALYALSPYVLQYATRTSVLLLPFAGLPWLISLAARAVRTGGWRHPAAFALVLALVGSVNATSILLVGLGPALWMLWSVQAGESSWRAALASATRIGLLSALTSAWWVVALAVQSRHGLPVLAYTETIEDVATTASAPEVLRGLGYWVFYGREVLDPNVGAAVGYTQNPALLTLSYLIPGCGLAAAAALRFPHRAYFVTLIGIGTLVAVGAHPIDEPSALASLIRGAADTTPGLALRSSTRAVPLVALGLAACLGQAVATVRAPSRRWSAAALAGVVALANLPALWTSGFVDDGFSRPEHLPSHWEEAGRWLDERPDPGGVLELPGSQYATYRWGTTYEPVTPGLTERAVLAREQLPWGSAASADLLIALDRRLQEGLGDLEALAPVARMLGARWVLLRNDLAFERYVSPRPRALWADLLPLPDGLRRAASFGRPVENVPDPRLPMLDEEALALPDGVADPAPIEMLEVSDPAPHLRLERPRAPIVVDGDGEGVVDAAAAGLLDGRRTLLYAGSVLGDEALFQEIEAGRAPLVVTDTNRKRLRRWRSVRWATGYTEAADEDRPAGREGDAELSVFPDSPPGSETTVEQVGGTIRASTYGGPFTLDPDARPALAADGRPETAWTIGPYLDPVGAWLRLRPAEPVPTDRLLLLQRSGGSRITELDVTVNGGAPRRVHIDARSLEGAGQPVALAAPGPVAEIEVRVAAVDGTEPVGIAELSIGADPIEEVVVLPSALVDAVGASAESVTYVLTRLRSDPSEPVRGDEERALRRRIEVARDQAIRVTGQARLSTRAASTADALLRPGSKVMVAASSSLPGALHRRPSAALDGDLATRWESAFTDVQGAWIEAVYAEPVTIDRLELVLVADGRHSVPTRLTVEVDGQHQQVQLPAVPDGDRPGATSTLTVPLQVVTGSTVRVWVSEARPVVTTDYYSRAPLELPVGVAELGLPGPVAVEVATVDTGCRDDLLLLDGAPIRLRVTGSSEDAVAGRPLRIEACEPRLLAPGTHDLSATLGTSSGIDLDRLVLAAEEPVPAPTPVEDLGSQPGLRHRAMVPAGQGGWVVLAQSHSEGWEAELDGEDLGLPTLVDGGSSGWRIRASEAPRSLVIRWAPQRAVDIALVVSAMAALGCLGLLLATRRRSAAGVVSVGSAARWLPWRRPPLEWSPGAAGACVAVAVVAAIALHPLAGVLVGILAAGSILLPVGRTVVTATVVLVWSGAALWIIVSQVLRPRRPDFEWIAGSLGPHRLALFAVLLLLTTIVTDHLHRRDAREGQSPPDPGPDGRAMAGPGPRSARHRRAVTGRPLRRFALASALGGLLGLVLFGWLLTLGRADGLMSWQRVGDFYDNQAKAWLDGRWDLSPETLGIESFEARGRTYMYQGPWPALLRLPVFALTYRFEGRLTQLSMLGAMVVAVGGATALHWQIRRRLRPDPPVGSVELALAGLAMFTVTGGSALLFLASRAWVYHEASMWGVAWSLVALAALVAYVGTPGRGRLAVAGLATTLALCSRTSVGLGPVVGLAIVSAGNALAWLRARLTSEGRPGSWLRWFRWAASGPTASGRRPVLAPAIAAVLPLVVYAATNWIKFRSLFSVPFEAQGFTLADEQRREMLAANGGTLFGLQFLPTTTLQYLRPDAWSLTRAFPFVDFAAPTAPVGNVTFDLIDRSTSIPVAMPALVLLTLVGIAALARARHVEPGAGVASLAGPLLGGLAGALTILPFGYIANRYLADAVPFLALGALLGTQVLLPRWDVVRRSVRRLALGGVVVLILGGAWLNLSLALIYQRLYSTNIRDDVSAAFVDARYDVAQALGIDPEIPLIEVEELPERAPRGTLAAVGDCDGLYLSDGMDVNEIKITPWNAVERSEAAGRWRRRATFPTQPIGTRQPLLSLVSADGPGVLYAEWTGGNGVVFAWQGPGDWLRSPIREVPPERVWDLDMVVDPNIEVVQLLLDGQVMLESYYHPTQRWDRAEVAVDLTGDPVIEDTFTGRFEPVPTVRGLCAELRDEARAQR